MNKFICIHGHFYQPPRENPWLEAVELQDSAYPFHDWNERITTECYLPNAASRILDQDNMIKKIVNNYEKISFNFGPTLLSWLSEKHPDLVQAIVNADKISQSKLNGHGNAIAQAYNHMILPLASPRDKYTQIYWGIRNFEYFFDRSPEGFWLPETAVDIETLEILSEHGIQFTILAPNQAKAVKEINSHEWIDVSDSRIDPHKPYLIRLPSGNTLHLFFYDGPTSKAIAFEKLLNRGEDFANQLLSAFSQENSENCLEHISTDGETYGHHHNYGDMSLAYAVDFIESNQDTEIINYARFLEIQPATHEVEIYENSSWSCAHGIERWKSHCGCNTGQKDWKQEWRSPLRQALDWLRDTISPLFEKEAGKLINDPWAARNDYIVVIQDRNENTINHFFNHHAKKELSLLDKQIVLKWMELMRHAQLMYTSCAWFFDEISGLETVQVLKYAGRVIQLANELLNRDFESVFLSKLEKALSNIENFENGKTIYLKFIKPSFVSLRNVAVHYAACLVFEELQDEIIYCYRINPIQIEKLESGKARLGIGQIEISSTITLEKTEVYFVVIHFGDQNLTCAIKNFDDTFEFQSVKNEVIEAFNSGNLVEGVKLIEQYFDTPSYSLKDLFIDQQRIIMSNILEETLQEVDAAYHQFFDRHITMLDFIGDLNMPLPAALKSSADYVINANIKKMLKAERPDLNDLKNNFEQAKRLNTTLDQTEIAFIAQQLLNRLIQEFIRNQNDTDLLDYIFKLTDFLLSLPITIDLWEAQNTLHSLHNQNNQQAFFNEQLQHELRMLAEKLQVRL